ncbi:hypothetical protein [Acinetobacter sp. CFCC 10889]|uniref:hypothetical protein n=1 Tax=Acinetobacter sp. CFCC 10889 TaxID=1775557 RepID=UPI000DCFFC94|nr:hypothetical protein [Acinetobacter sp. CFCC 10889]
MKMSVYSPTKDRSGLEKEMAEYEKNGGTVQVIESSSIRYEKEQIVRRGLHYTIHHPFISKETGLSVVLLKSIKRMPYAAEMSHIEKLYQFFKDRDLSQC